jgi:hypothetical protein
MSVAGMIRRAARRGGNRKITLTRYSPGSFRGGVFQPGGVEFRREIEASVQPLTQDKVEITVNDLARMSSYVMILTTERLVAADKTLGQNADELNIDGELFIIESVDNFRFRHLQHFEAVASRKAVR